MTLRDPAAKLALLGSSFGAYYGTRRAPALPRDPSLWTCPWCGRRSRLLGKPHDWHGPALFASCSCLQACAYRDGLPEEMRPPPIQEGEHSR